MLHASGRKDSKRMLFKHFIEATVMRAANRSKTRIFGAAVQVSDASASSEFENKSHVKQSLDSARAAIAPRR